MTYQFLLISTIVKVVSKYVPELFIVHTMPVCTYMYYNIVYYSTQNSGFFPYFHLAVIPLASRSNNWRRTRLRVRVTRPDQLAQACLQMASRQARQAVRQARPPNACESQCYRTILPQRAPSSARTRSAVLCCASYIAVLDYVQGKTTTQFLSRANRVCFSKLKRTTTQRLTLNPYPIMDSGDCNSPT